MRVNFCFNVMFFFLSPNTQICAGSTAAGLSALERGGLRYTIIEALEKATKKCKETSKAV